MNTGMPRTPSGSRGTKKIDKQKNGGTKCENGKGKMILNRPTQIQSQQSCNQQIWWSISSSNQICLILKHPARSCQDLTGVGLTEEEEGAKSKEEEGGKKSSTTQMW
jgi:hypothetical protein